MSLATGEKAFKSFRLKTVGGRKNNQLKIKNHDETMHKGPLVKECPNYITCSGGERDHIQLHQPAGVILLQKIFTWSEVSIIISSPGVKFP